MPLPQEIQTALRVYDDNKGFWRRLFRRDQAAIRALRRLSDTEQTNLLKIYPCFIENLPKTTQASYTVYQTVLTYLNQIDFSGIPGTMDELYTAKLLKPKNLDKLTKLKGNHFRLLANLLNQLKNCQLLTQTNFDNIAKTLETPEEEDISLELTIIASAVDVLRNKLCLNQENFNTILEKPNIAANMASALIVLDQTELLISANRSKLLDTANQFLLSDAAYNLVWCPLASYLPRLVDVDERQSVLNRIIELAQQENPVEKIKIYLCGLISEFAEFDMTRKHGDNKFFSAPPQNTKLRSSLNNLVELSERPGTL